MLSGAALLVGDRPAGPVGRSGAGGGVSPGLLPHDRRKKILERPEHLEVFLTHGAGSLCGGNIGSRLSRPDAIRGTVVDGAGVLERLSRRRRCSTDSPWSCDLERLPQITVHELRRRLDAGQGECPDVRQPEEWATGHARGATFITGAELPGRLDEVPPRTAAGRALPGRATGRRRRPASSPESRRRAVERDRRHDPSSAQQQLAHGDPYRRGSPRRKQAMAWRRAELVGPTPHSWECSFASGAGIRECPRDASADQAFSVQRPVAMERTWRCRGDWVGRRGDRDGTGLERVHRNRAP